MTCFTNREVCYEIFVNDVVCIVICTALSIVTSFHIDHFDWLA